MIKYILFDLDGTLLPMDEKVFEKDYFKRMAIKVAPLGYNAEDLIKNILIALKAMIMNDGSKTNEEVFWNNLKNIYGDRVYQDKAVFNEYYKNEFQLVKDSCGYNPKAGETIFRLKELGYKVALATNPIFPKVATDSRVRWAGCKISDFELYSTYENTNYCKPNLEYYKDFISKLNANANECLMVGNNVDEDMIIEKLGSKVFLLSDCIINKNNIDISKYPNGSFDQLMDYIQNQ